MDDRRHTPDLPISDLPFDERKALAELEHFRREIERYQAERHGVSNEFERFIHSFKSPDSVPPVVPTRTTPAGRPAASTAPTVVAPVIPVAVAPEPPVAAKPAAPRADNPFAGFPTRLRVPQLSSRSWLVVGSAIAILSVGGYALVRSMGDSTPPPSAATPPAPAPNATPAPPVTQNAAPAAATSPTKPLPYEAVLTTTESVWLRVTADGERVAEREVRAGERLAFIARDTIVIRAGNPSAVRLMIGGVDQGSLGREGIPVTRTFTVPK